MIHTVSLRRCTAGVKKGGDWWDAQQDWNGEEEWEKNEVAGGCLLTVSRATLNAPLHPCTLCISDAQPVKFAIWKKVARAAKP